MEPIILHAKFKSHSSSTFTSQQRLHLYSLHGQMNKERSNQLNELTVSLEEKKMIRPKVTTEEEMGRESKVRTAEGTYSPPSLSPPRLSLLPPR